MKNKRTAITLAAVMVAGAAATAAIGSNLPAFNDGRVLAKEEETEALLTESSPASSDSISDGYLPDIKGITNSVMPSIVAITTVSVEQVNFWGRVYEQKSEGSGSGIIVGKTEDELLIATNNHVIEGGEDLTVSFSVETEDEDDTLAPARIKGTDSSLDLAVIAVKLEDIPDEVAGKISVIEMGNSDEVSVGDWSIAIGNALGYGQSVTFGIISALDREVSLSTENGMISNAMLQTDAAINFGNSGGALLDDQGRLIGINSAKAAETGVEGMGYAIPINTAKPIIEDLMNQTTRDKVDEDKAGALGVTVQDVSEEAKEIYNVPAGAVILEVSEGSAAEKAGIKKGDVISRLEKTTITSSSELLDRMQYYEAGETIEVTVHRMGADGFAEQVLEVTLDEKPVAEEEDSYNDNTVYPDDEENFQEEVPEDEDFYFGLEEAPGMYDNPMGFLR